MCTTSDGGQVLDPTYRGAVVCPNTYQGCEAIQATSDGDEGYSVRLQNGADYQIWNANAEGACTGTVHVAALIDYEDRLQFEFNRDGAFDHTVSDIDTISVGLQTSTNSAYYVVRFGTFWSCRHRHRYDRHWAAIQHGEGSHYHGWC